jgi:branched-subunit amino acid aminotransferase/4-amino-4-deoxychorismate lyase
VSATGRHPDPAQGIIETLLVVGGEPVETAGHLARLEASLAEIYAAELPAETAERVRAAAAGLDLGRLRLTAVPRPGGIELEVSPRPVDPEVVFPATPKGAELRRVNRPGGHGAHKWVDRAGMDRPSTGPGQLICDGTELLEAGWANLFAIHRQALWTPPADGRILAGMARAAVLEIAREEGLQTYERPLTAADLLNADEVFLTNSVRGIEPAVALDGDPLPGSGPLSRRLADALRRRWGLTDVADDPPAPATAPQPGQLSH